MLQDSMEFETARPWDRIAPHHIGSYNHYITDGLRELARDVVPEEFSVPLPSSDKDKARVRMEVISLASDQPTKANPSGGRLKIGFGSRLFPAECREAGLDYGGVMTASMKVTVQEAINDDVRNTGCEITELTKNLGAFPVMVKSKMCHLQNMGETELIKKREEPSEFGGYFILKGREKLFRFIIASRRNFPLAIERPSNAKKGEKFSSKAVYIRCVRGVHLSSPLSLHYVKDGTMVLRARYHERSFDIPLGIILRAFTDKSDQEIVRVACFGSEGRSVSEHSHLKAEYQRYNTTLKKIVSNALRTNGRIAGGVTVTKKVAHEIIGNRYRRASQLPEWYTNEEIAQAVLTRIIFVHLDTEEEKFELLIYMVQKLTGFFLGMIAADSPDSLVNQELINPGHIMGHFMKEKLEMMMKRVKEIVLKEVVKGSRFHKPKTGGTQPEPQSSAQFIKNVLQATSAALASESTVYRDFSYLFNTGNIRAVRGSLGVPQMTGLTVFAERINMLRFMSHFRVVHRGMFFVDSRSPDARKFRAENYGFVCPTHTPDGKLCGILNHLSRTATVTHSVNLQDRVVLKLAVTKTLHDAGLLIDARTRHFHAEVNERLLVVFMDGTVIGHVTSREAPLAERAVRYMKFDSTKLLRHVSRLEVTLVKEEDHMRQIAPGLFIFSENGRLIRPVRNMERDCTEWIGSMEQDRIQIACFTKGPNEMLTERCTFTHQELRADSILETVAGLSPFSDHNHGCRTIYQVQMAKQTMGVPGYTVPWRLEQKSYFLQAMQTPITRSHVYEEADIDKYPLGLNAMVAVLCYTGFDMEDAMVINKMSFERGYGFGHVLKTMEVNILKDWISNVRFTGLISRDARVERCPLSFRRDAKQPLLAEFLDKDGLPYVGQIYKKNDPFYCYYDSDSMEFTVRKYKYNEAGYIASVRVAGVDSQGRSTQALNRIMINVYYPRRPQPGDKFASRHGQKGILSFLYPTADLPFTESGMTPDIIFNPHGVPSRMTVGKFIEAMAGKAAYAGGVSRMEAAPFAYTESEKPCVELFGEKLQELGYNFYGREAMYSGVTGKPFLFDVFFGPIYYQRLRHMVEDKFQARSTGAVEARTRQPVHGRQRGGGVRFGEMERDTLVAYGTPFVLRDRLMDSSDADVVWACANCGDLFATFGPNPDPHAYGYTWQCRLCGRDDNMAVVRVPYVLRTMAGELQTFGIRLKLNIEKKKICVGHSQANSKVAKMLQIKERPNPIDEFDTRVLGGMEV